MILRNRRSGDPFTWRFIYLFILHSKSLSMKLGSVPSQKRKYIYTYIHIYIYLVKDLRMVTMDQNMGNIHELLDVTSPEFDFE